VASGGKQSRAVRGRLAILALAALAAAAVGAFAAPARAARPPHVKHVFIVVLENENVDVTFGALSPAPYLARRLPAKGELMPNYYAIAHNSNPNYLAMISGQGPNVQTQADCLFYDDFFPGLRLANGQVFGTGCVYPPGVETVANQLEDSGYSWHGYMQDLNAGASAGQQTPCRHPALGSFDRTQSARRGDQYAARHDPFVYFHSIIDFPTCRRNVVDLGHLRKDLRRERRTPNYSFIVPNLCNDGHDSPCVDGRPGGLVSANAFLRRWVPRIVRSPAYRHRGLLIVTFDEAEATGSKADSSACCHELPSPNTLSNGGLHPGPGGGRTGAVLLSPCIRPGTVVSAPYNHYSLLRSIEDNFGLPHLGYAGQAGLEPFGANVLNRHRCGRP
jgi:phospholipase C